VNRTGRWRVVLASASPARLQLLRQSGIQPDVVVSGIDEDAVAAGLPGATVADLTVALARAKAVAVAAGLTGDRVLVIGADSLFTIGDEVCGKPRDAAEARRRWSGMSGSSGQLVTGHCLIRGTDGRQVTAAVTTTVHLGVPDPAELDYYIGTGEPMAVAGGLTIDGLGAPFVEGVTGDPSNVIGLSLPGVRRLIHDLGMTWPDLVHRRVDAP
jgi:septum formation protein